MSVSRKVPKWRRWLWRLLLVGCGAILLLFLSAEWLVNTAFGKKQLTRQLEKRTGLEWTVDSIELGFPWSYGVSGLKAQQPESLRKFLDQPVFQAKNVSLTLQKWPDKWKLWPKDLIVEQARGVISVEMLVNLLHNPSIRYQSPAPQQKKQPPTKKPQLQKPLDPQKNTEPEKRVPSKPGPKKKAIPPRPPLRPPFTVTLVDSNISCVRASSGKTLFALDGLSMELPLSGEDREGSLSWKSYTALDMIAAPTGEMDVSWARPNLQLKDLTGELLGLKYQSQFVFNPYRSGNFFLALNIPEQSWSDSQLEITKIQGGGRVSGVLANRSTWRGVGSMLVQDVKVGPQWAGEAVDFRQGLVTFDANAFGVVLPTVRLVGDQASFLGNGVAFRNGQVAAVMRMIMSQEWARVVDKKMTEVGYTEPGQGWMQESPTPDRAMRDVHLQGNVGQMFLNIEQDGGWVPAKAFVQELKRVFSQKL